MPIDAANTHPDVDTKGIATCAVRSDRTLLCWGTNGNLRVAFVNTPTVIDGATDWANVSVGRNNVCAVRKNGALACWGLAGALPAAGVSTQVPTNIGVATD